MYAVIEALPDLHTIQKHRFASISGLLLIVNRQHIYDFFPLIEG
jgi:hypothetical protein